MKKFLKLVSAAVVTVSVGIVPAVSALATASTCTISTTGPSSNNICTVSGNTTVTVTCVNGVNVTNLNNQTALTGPATVTNNTVSGNATSGDASNLNAAATTLAQNCAAAPVTTPATTATTTTPTTSTSAAAPSAGGRGAGAVQGVSTVKVAALPNTGPNTLVTGLAVSAVAAGVLAGLAHFALRTYRRLAFKA